MSVTAHDVASAFKALDVVICQPDFTTPWDSSTSANIVRHGDTLTATSLAKCLVDFFETPRNEVIKSKLICSFVNLLWHFGANWLGFYKLWSNSVTALYSWLRLNPLWLI